MWFSRRSLPILECGTGSAFDGNKQIKPAVLRFRTQFAEIECKSLFHIRSEQKLPLPDGGGLSVFSQRQTDPDPIGAGGLIVEIKGQDQTLPGAEAEAEVG